MISFTFCEKNSSDFGISIENINRPLLPELSKNQVKITNRQGLYDFEDNTYDNRIIEVAIGFKGITKEERIQKTRQIAAWLSQKGNLTFSDEPNVHYIGRIYNSANLGTFIRLGRATLIFDCEPFGYSDIKTTEISITNMDQNLTLQSEGTFETPFRLKLKNVGNNTINQITLIKIE